MARFKWGLAALLLWLACAAQLNRALEVEDTDVSDDEYEEPVEKAFLIVRKKIFEPEKVVLGKNVTVVISVYNAGNRQATQAFTQLFSPGIATCSYVSYAAYQRRAPLLSFMQMPCLSSAAHDVTVEDGSWPEEHFSHSQDEARASYPRCSLIELLSWTRALGTRAPVRIGLAKCSLGTEKPHDHTVATTDFLLLCRIAAGASVELKYKVWPLGEGGQFHSRPAVVQYRPESDSQEVQVLMMPRLSRLLSG